MATRRAGQTGQFDTQGRSHEAPDCGSYKLLERTGPSRWLIELTAECDREWRTTMTVSFVSAKEYSRYF